jgi:AMP nucleosidase
MPRTLTPHAAVDALAVAYDRAIGALRDAMSRYISQGIEPTPDQRALFRYPELRVHYDGRSSKWGRGGRSYAQLIWAGDYAASITQPQAFRPYLEQQLAFLTEDYGARISVGVSESEIPYPFVLDGSQELDADRVRPADLARHFPYPKLSNVGDAVIDGEKIMRPDGARPLSLFEAPRVDMSLKRIEHYCGTHWQDVQPWILFTNYQRYVEEFVRWAAGVVAETPGAILSCPGRVRLEHGQSEQAITQAALGAPWRKFQMPAYHLVQPNERGVTLVNIGVGPSNAKTITDHLAVLRPHCWIMVGHCGGLRNSQRIGDYVLAHAYLRRDKILDDQVPLEIPIPAIAEVQVALQRAALEASEEGAESLKARLRTGTVVSYADRNWELNFADERKRLSQSRAIAVDMESACIATQGFRLRVPYGVLLCVSDKPLHGEIKLPGAADKFYERAIGAHLQIGIRTIELLQEDVSALHSRKLRSFDEPAFR